MKCSGKKLALIGALLIAIGLLVSFLVLVMTDYDLSKLSGGKYTEKTYTVSEDFNLIGITVDTADVELVFAEGEECKVVCSETERLSYNVYVNEDGCLYVETVKANKWYNHFDLKNIFGNWGENKVIVYLPKTEYDAISAESDTGDIKILDDFRFESISAKSDTGDIIIRASAEDKIWTSTDTGDIILDTASAGSVHAESNTGLIMMSSVEANYFYDFNTNTGDVTFENCEAKSVDITTDTGDVTLRLVIVEEKLNVTTDTGYVTLNNAISNESINVTTDTGDVIFDKSDAGEIYVTTDTGDVKGSLLSDKVFLVDTDTGSVNVPRSITGGRCEITTDTGDVNITIE